ncbi:acyl-CoA thioesterase [Actinoalloteichus caeruleus]|uniref:acyl-CoA thioesterase n=1 Tax=Actinoalloteichus cyanogriseus TaxID=2893586 RepID=UPI0004AAF0D3|nr:thioesterase family protein [Actinoalloteichus caeruleus]
MNLYLRLLLLRWRMRRRRRLSVWDVARTPFRVTVADLDLLRHMNNGKYLSILDLGRMDLMVRSGFWEKLVRAGWYPVVAGQTIPYRRSLRLGQRFDLYTRVVGFDDRWAYLEQTFCVGRTVYAQAVVRSRFLRRSGGSVDHDELAELVGGFPERLRVPAWMREWAEHTRVDTEFPVVDDA